MISLNVEPGAYWPAIARLSSGSFALGAVELAVVLVRDAADEQLRVVVGVARDCEHPSGLRIDGDDRAGRSRACRACGCRRSAAPATARPAAAASRSMLVTSVSPCTGATYLPVRDRVALRAEVLRQRAVDAAQHGVVLLFQTGHPDRVGVGELRVVLLVGCGDLRRCSRAPARPGRRSGSSGRSPSAIATPGIVLAVLGDGENDACATGVSPPAPVGTARPSSTGRAPSASTG